MPGSLQRQAGRYSVMENRNRLIAAGILVAAALISFLVIGNLVRRPENFSDTIKMLDEKSETVMALTGAAAAASAAITVLPGDVGTPIAEKLLDMSGYFMVALAAIYLEKWLITIIGAAAFMVLIPIALIGLAVDLFIPGNAFRMLFIRLLCFALVMFIAVPASVQVAKMVDDNYGVSIKDTIEEAEKKSKEVQDQANGETAQNALEKIFNQVSGGVNAKVEEFKTILSKFVEAAAVLIVTSCVIPLAVMLFFGWVIKMLINVQITIPDIGFSRK